MWAAQNHRMPRTRFGRKATSETHAATHVRRKANGVFILVEPEQPNVILGCYTLCATGLTQGDVPAAARKHIPRYPLVSATLIGRLAVSQARQGERLGAMLLADAVRRAYRSADTVSSSMLVVDALHDRAAAFYEGNGFVRLPDSLHLILPMHAIRQMMETWLADAIRMSVPSLIALSGKRQLRSVVAKAACEWRIRPPTAGPGTCCRLPRRGAAVSWCSAASDRSPAGQSQTGWCPR